MHPKSRAAYRNPSGSILVVVLLVMTAISIFGIMSINTSTVELNIARNEREMREVFYLSESAALEGVQRLIDTPPIDLEEKIQYWHHGIEAAADRNLDFRNPRKWDVDGRGEDNGMRSALDQNAHFSAVEHRLAAGSSAIVTEPRLYMNQVFGLSTKYHAVSLVEIGYYLRY